MAAVATAPASTATTTAAAAAAATARVISLVIERYVVLGARSAVVVAVAINVRF